MPKAEGDALAVYFAVNISREPGDIRRSGRIVSDARLPLGAGSTVYNKRNMVFHPARAAPFGRQAYHLPPEGGTKQGVNLLILFFSVTRRCK